jgi:hypothetical protein
MLDLSCVLFHFLDIRVRLRNLLGMLFHNAYNRYNLLLEEQTQFVQLYNRPKVPFLEHHMDRHGHTEYIQYMYHKLLHCVT